MGSDLPFKEIKYDDSIWHALANKPNTIFLDGCERYSYILINPRKIWYKWRTWPEDTIISKHPELPPFQGGIAGFLSYDLAHQFNPTKNYLNSTPKIICGFYEQLFAFDHQKQQAWKIWQNQEPEIPEAISAQGMRFNDINQEFGEYNYIKLVQNIKERILNGDVYQVNISENFRVSGNFRPNDLYRMMRKISPAPFSCFANFSEFSILSSSPERFLKICNNKITTYPIKGTVERLQAPDLDEENKTWLLASKKDKAENIMIVDLMRSDFSKFCEPNSVVVEELCELYSFTNVHHLISTVSGQLLAHKNVFDALEACMAAGSITGAPKAMAMDIISQIEQKARGPYCGHVFWTDGINLDSNILIRTAVATADQISFRVGGGITHLSDPVAEYREVLVKAKNLITLCSQ